jgi:DNA-binding MarR family transcriptional regulator
LKSLDPRDCTCLRLRAATRRLTQRYDDALAPSGLRIGQFSILAFVSECGKPSVGEVADYFDMAISTATRNLRPLVSAGYLSLK